MAAAHEDDVNTVGDGNQHGGNVVDGDSCVTGAQSFHGGFALEAFGGQACLCVVTQSVSHGGAGGAAVGHVELDVLAVEGLLLHGSLFLGGGSQVEIQHLNSAAFDFNRVEQSFPVAGSECFGRVQVLVGFVDFHLDTGLADSDGAVVVGVAFDLGLLFGDAAGSQGQNHGQSQQQCNDLLHQNISPHYIFDRNRSIPRISLFK